MITWDSTQQSIAASSSVRILWAFDITAGGTTYYWSTSAFSFGGNNYSAVIPAKTFSGIVEKRRCAEDGRLNGTDLVFGAYRQGFSPSTFDNAVITVRLIMSDGTNTREMRNWVFVARTVGLAYGLLTFQCVDLLTHYLQGTYPTTQLIRYIWPDKNAIPDNMCVPIPYGTVYIPVRPVWCTPTGQPTGRYYLLGPAAYTYTISKIRSPRETQKNIVWTTGFSQYTADGYKVLKAIIADANGDGVADSQGLWWTTKLLDAPLKFSRSDTASTTNPALILKSILEGMGIPSSFISYSSAQSTYTTWGLTWNGALFVVEERATLLARLLMQCNSTIDYNGVTLRPLSASSVATISKSTIISGTYSDDPQLSDTPHDSAYILYQDADEPWDQYNQILVTGSGTTDSPSGVQYLCDFVHNSTAAMKVGRCAAQRIVDIIGYSRCAVKPSLANLQPYDVITLSDSDGIYRAGTYEIDEVSISREGVVSLSLRRYGHSLLDYTGISASPPTIATPSESNTWSVVISGPDTASGTLPNTFPGRINIGADLNTRIVIEPNDPNYSGPVIFMKQAGNERLRIGVLDALGKYGLSVNDGSGTVLRIDQTSSYIAGWTITPTAISKGGLVLDSTTNSIKAENGSNKVEFSPSGIRGYSATLGEVFNLPSDGSAPTFSSGVIKEAEYQVYTSGVIKTSINPVTSGGFLINNTRAAAYNAAGTKLFEVTYAGTDQGDFYVGQYATGGHGIFYDHSAGQLYIRGSLLVDAGIATYYQSSAPANPDTGDLWFDTVNLLLKRWNGSTWQVCATDDSGFRASADQTKIDGGKIYVGSTIKVGSTSGGYLIVNQSKTGYADGNTGVFLGYSSGWKFEIYGNSSNYLRWDGTSLELKGTLTVTGGSGLANFSDAGALATKNAADYATDVTGAKPPFGATPGSCFILDPTFEESAGSWGTYWFRSHTDVLMSTSYGEAGYGVRIPAPGSGNSHSITNLPTNTTVAQNDVIYIAARLKSNSLNGSVYLRIWMYDYNKTYLATSSADVTSKLVSGSWVTVTARVTVTHASARYCRAGISVADATSGSLDVDNFYAYAHDPGATNDADIRASADQTKIDGGKLYVGSQIKIGSTSGGYLIINQDKTGYADGQPGVFLGYSSGWKFEIYGSSSHYLRWDGSTLTVRGALSASNLTTGTLPMDRIAAGSITASKIAAGTITAAEIASGTITANEINGSSFGVLTISSGRIIANVSQAFVVGQSGTLAFYVYNGTGAYIQGGTSQYLKVYSPYYVQVVGTNIYLDANTTYLRYGSSTPLLAVGTTYVITYTDILPNVTQTCWVGNSSLRFQGAYFYNLYIRNYYSFDTVDDLAFIENIPVVKDATGGLEVDADGRSIVDVSSCDLRITNARHLCAELSQETGTIITPSDLETLRNGKMTEIAGPKGSVRWSEVADRLSLDVGALCGLYIGALKQVSGRLKALEERMRGHS